MTITLDTVRAAAQRLGAAADVSRALAAALQARLQEAVRPIYAAARDALDALRAALPIEVIPISAATGDGIPALLAALARTLDELPPRS